MIATRPGRRAHGGVLMKPCKLASLLGVLLLAVASSGCKKLQARDQLNKGVLEFRGAHFQAAIDHFQQAVALDPDLLNAKMYLAESYFQQYAPGGQSPDNVKAAHSAIDAFQKVLDADPSNNTALAYIGLIYYYLPDLPKAKEYQQRRSQNNPNDPEPYYWIGEINWNLAARNDSAIRNADPKLQQADNKGDLPPLPEKVRVDLAQKNTALIDEGMQALQKAVDLKPNYNEAMAYLNLLYRQKADIEADGEARAADLKNAGDWLAKALAARATASNASGASSGTTQ
jgi:tetratricopeptide (TPR) repeat protein